jgi:type I restriction enzyme, S subunit
MAFNTSLDELVSEDKTGLLAKHPTWERIKLEEIAQVLNGYPFDSEKFSSSGGLPLIRIRDVLEGITQTFYQGASQADYLVNAGDLLIGMDGDFHCARWKSEPSLLNQRVCKITPQGDFYSLSFLTYVLPGFLSAINEHTPSVTVKHLSSKTIGSIPLPLPSRTEQTRIVTKLEELLSALDTGVAELKAAQKKLAQYRQSLLKAAVSGELTAAWREKNPPKETGQQLLQRILRERRSRWETTQLAKFQAQGKVPPKEWREKYVEPVQPDVSELPQLPKGWIWASGDQLCDLITKGTTPPKEMKNIGEQVIPFLRVTNLTFHGTLDLRDEVFVSQAVHAGFLARSMVFPNDVLMNIVGPPLGQVAVVPDSHSEWNINQAIAIFRPIETVLPNFLCRYLLSNLAQKWFAQRAKTTAGQTNLTLEMCRYLPIPVPPSQEQVAIVDLCGAVLDSCLQQGKAIEASLKQSAAQRKNILQAAFSGQLVPQDPADEPASALLARIRAARDASIKAPSKAAKPARKSRSAA